MDLTYAVLDVLSNPLPAPNVKSRGGPAEMGEGMHLSAAGQNELALDYGVLSLGTDQSESRRCGQQPGLLVSRPVV